MFKYVSLPSFYFSMNFDVIQFLIYLFSFFSCIFTNGLFGSYTNMKQALLIEESATFMDFSSSFLERNLPTDLFIFLIVPIPPS